MSEEHDLNNAFLDSLTEPGADQPDYLVLSVGAHEVIGWSGRPQVELNMDVFRSDVEELLALLRRTFTRGKVIWWKAHQIWPGKVRDADYYLVKEYHRLYQEYAYRRFTEEGHIVADFFQTTADRPDLLYSPDGVHYGGGALRLHSEIVANIIC
eukprot:jgi/Mesen1/1905/ME000143S00963